MKKIIRLTESDLTRIVRKIINEQPKNIFNNITDFTKMYSKANSLLDKAKEELIKNYRNPETIKKFKNKNNINKIIAFLPNITLKIYKTEQESPNKDSLGWVNKSKPTIINLNLFKLPQDKLMWETIFHEASHLVDFYMSSLGEDKITTSTQANYSPSGGQDNYVASETETFVRMQRLRQVLGMSPNESPQGFADKLINAFKEKKFLFKPDDKSISVSGDKKFLIFKPKTQEKGVLSNLWSFYANLYSDGTNQQDISALFAANSKIKPGIGVELDIYKLANININTKGFNN